MTKRANLVPLQTFDMSPYERWGKLQSITCMEEAKDVDKAYLAICALYDAGDEQRKELKRPFLDGCQHYDKQWREARKPLETLKEHLGNLLATYEERLRKDKVAALKRSKLKDTERKNAMVLTADNEPSIQLPCGNWIPEFEIEVTDLSRVPHELLQVDLVKVRKLAKDGIGNIPGLHITRRYKRSAKVPKGGVL